MELREEHEKERMECRLKAIFLNTIKGPSEYQQLQRTQTERNKLLYNFKCTIFELLNVFRLAYDCFYSIALRDSRTEKRGIRMKHREVARNDDGGYNTSNT